MLSHAEIIH